MCSQLKEGQLEIFHYVMKHAVEYMLDEKNSKPLPHPMYFSAVLDVLVNAPLIESGKVSTSTNGAFGEEQLSQLTLRTN